MHTEASLPPGSALSARGILNLLNGDPPLISPVTDREQQLQPNGFDLTLESIWRVNGTGAIGVTNDDRVIPPRVEVTASSDGWFELTPGLYVIRFREVVALPLDVMGVGWPRSSLLRSGVVIHTSVWDAGYHGRSEALLVVHPGSGVRLAVGARVLQIVFMRLDEATHGYAGTYQGENLPGPRGVK